MRVDIDKNYLNEKIIFSSDHNFFKSSIEKLTAKKKVIFISEDLIWSKCKKFFPKNFEQKFEKCLLLKKPKADEKNIKIITNNLKNFDFIVGLGSGTINDLCKYSAFQNNISYAIIPSALSMNGFLSKNASITISGHKKTLPATLPFKVLCDLRILKSAPKKLTKAGIGDSLCFYSCWFDWYLSHKLFGTKFSKKPFDILQNEMEFFLKNFQNFKITDENFLKILAEILMLSGLGMTIAEGSYPASQSEHMISHAIEMKYPELSKKNLHGQQIAVATITSAKIQKELLKMSEIAICSEEKIKLFFNKKISAECQKEYDQKLEIVKKSEIKNWNRIKKDLGKIYRDDSFLKKIFLHFKISTSPRSIGISEKQYMECVSNAKYIRNRITCLDFEEKRYSIS